MVGRAAVPVGDPAASGPAVPPAEAVRIRLLGGFEVKVGSRSIAEDRFRLKKARSVVKLLGLADGHAMHRERISDLLWPDLDARHAANNLYRALHFARAALGSGPRGAPQQYLVLREGLVSLCPQSALWVDVEAFEDAAAVARRSGRPGPYRSALDLYPGDLLPGDRYEVWAEEKRAALRQLRRALLLELAALLEEREHYGGAVDTLERASAQEPADEVAAASLMRLHALLGRRQAALLQYERLRLSLSEQLGSQPGASVRRMYEEIRAGKVPVPRPDRARRLPAESTSVPNNLSAPLTSFVGREKDLTDVSRSLSMTRLLTLTGAGGSGKTRLALEVSRQLTPAYAGGVWLAELAPLSDPDLVPRAVAAALGVREQPHRPITQTVCDSFGSDHVLLVLDNCEHLVHAAARLARDLLESCPNLTVLATSREALGIFGETVWPVPTLALPDPQAEITVETSMGTGAVRLFVDRARARLPDFELTPANARAVAEICRKLDGIPLAIELSTARMGALAVEQVVGRLEDSLGFLTGGDRTASPRHQTMRATLNWSYGLLSEPERALYARLSVFAGGFFLRAAEAVGAGGDIQAGGVLNLLSRLVDKSVVIVEKAGEDGLRYGMLQPVRQYGLERLDAAGEAEDVRRRHARWYFELAREVEPWLRGARREAWLGRLEQEYGNLRAALNWALGAGEFELALWFGATLAEFWYISGHLSESRRWLEAALEGGGNAASKPSRVRALARAGWIAFEQGDFERSEELSSESLVLSREIGDRAGVVAALTNLGWAALLSGELGKACALAEEANSLGRSLDDPGGVARALLIPALVAVIEGDHDRALALHDECLAMAREAEDGVATGLSLGTAVFACLGKGDLARARTLLEEGFANAPQPAVMVVTAFHLHAAAALASAQGRAARAARLWSAAETLRETIGASVSPAERRVYDPYVASARSGIEASGWDAAWAEGERMTVQQASAYALAQHTEERQQRVRQRPASRRKADEPGAGASLTRRQREVALLVARGLTNAQIARELSISGNTVANHVAGIIHKLNLASRSQVAVWVTERRLREPS